MKRIIGFVVLLALLAACGQTSLEPQPSAAPPSSAPEALTLLAEATASADVREFIAEQLALDSGDYPELSKEVFHSEAFYRLVAAGTSESHSVDDVKKVFGALPNAYLMGSANTETWNALEEEPLITHLFADGDAEAETVTAYDASLTSYTLSAAEKPDRVLLVLHEGFDEEALISSQAVRPICNEANYGTLYTHTRTVVDSKERAARDQFSYQGLTLGGWNLEDATISIEKNRGGTVTPRLVNQGEHFITLTELKTVRDFALEYLRKLGLSDKKIELEIKNKIEKKYENYKKFTTSEVTERTFLVTWSIEDKWRPFGNHRLLVEATVIERCINQDATSGLRAKNAFLKVVDEARTPSKNGTVTFNTSPSSLTSVNLRITGNGKTYSSSGRGSSLSLPAGNYTVSGSGYSSSSGSYTASSHSFTVSAGKSSSVTVYMRQDNPGCPNGQIICPPQ